MRDFWVKYSVHHKIVPDLTALGPIQFSAGGTAGQNPVGPPYDSPDSAEKTSPNQLPIQSSFSASASTE